MFNEHDSLTFRHNNPCRIDISLNSLNQNPNIDLCNEGIFPLCMHTIVKKKGCLEILKRLYFFFKKEKKNNNKCPSLQLFVSSD